MAEKTELVEKYEYNHWPSLSRPDLKPPKGWNLPLVVSVERIHHHRLSPDGKSIAFIWNRGDFSDIYTMKLGKGWPNRISLGRAIVTPWTDEEPQWSPDGQWLAFCTEGRVHVVPTCGGLPQKVSSFGLEESSPKWMPDSKGLVVCVEKDEYTQLILTDRCGAWPRPLVSEAGDVLNAQPAPDGRLVAFVYRPRDDLRRLAIGVVDISNGQIRWLVSEPKQKNWWPRWSPDGNWIAFLSQRSGFNEIWMIKPDGSQLHQLTHVGRDCADLAWSPDGNRIACTINRDGAVDLIVVNVLDGKVSDLRVGQGVYTSPQWSPDGAFLVVEYESPQMPADLYQVSVTGGRMTPLTFSAPPALKALPLIMPEPISYKSYDGLEIPAFLYRPPKPNGAAILAPHGGPSVQTLFEWDVFAQYLVAKGYTYLSPNYRGSTGYGVAFEQANDQDWGNGDKQDCLYGGRYLQSLDWVSSDRLAIYGPSYGGYLVACCLTGDPDYLFACGVSKYGDAHLITSWAQCNRELRLYTEMFLGNPAENRQVYLKGSPIFRVDNVRKPILILHGLLDDIVPPQASEEWVAALRRADKAFEYKTYANEAHGFLKRATQLDAYERIERFLDWYLMPY